MKANTHTAGVLLSWATTALAKAGISTPRLDSLILMEDVLGLERAHLLAHLELVPGDIQYAKLRSLVEQRERHIPLAYIRGKVMFYGRSFYVTPNTLIPRPETEDCIDLLKTHFTHNETRSNFAIADVGAGSGCLGITAALELKGCSIALYDIDIKALEVAKKNAQNFGISAQYFHEDLLSDAKQRKYTAILANLPYVPEDYMINQDAQFEPSLALFAGSDGLDAYRSFWQQLKAFQVKPTLVLTESLPQLQHSLLIELAHKAGYESAETRGFVQLFKLSSQ